MKFTNIFRKKLEEKSYSPNLTANVIIDNQGNMIDTFYTNEKDQLKKNASVQTIVSKQSSIINEAVLVAKEKSEQSDEITKNKDILKILSWFENPNSQPSPRNLEDILRYIYKHIFTRNGLACLALTFKGSEFSLDNFKNIQLPQSSNIIFKGKEIGYQVQFTNQISKTFTFSNKYLNYVNYDGNELMILLVMGNYNIEEAKYESPFVNMIEYVKLQNYVIKFASSFHENACFPSQIVQMTYKNISPTEHLTDTQIKSFQKAVEQVKAQLKQSQSANNAGKMIVPIHPSLEIDIKPLSIPTNASDNISYQNFVSEKIFSFVDGGSAAAFEGKSEYANNASAKLKDLYDGSFRVASSVICKPLTNFIKNLLLVNKTKGDLDKFYLTFDISKVKLYQDQQVNQLFNILDRNLITINEGREMLGKFNDDYANLQDIPSGKYLNKEITKEVAVKQDNKLNNN